MALFRIAALKHSYRDGLKVAAKTIAEDAHQCQPI